MTLMSRIPELTPDSIADFKVWRETPSDRWVGKHLFSDRTVEAETLRGLELRACAVRIVHEWRNAE